MPVVDRNGRRSWKEVIMEWFVINASFIFSPCIHGWMLHYTPFSIFFAKQFTVYYYIYKCYKITATTRCCKQFAVFNLKSQKVVENGHGKNVESRRICEKKNVNAWKKYNYKYLFIHEPIMDYWKCYIDLFLWWIKTLMSVYFRI